MVRAASLGGNKLFKGACMHVPLKNGLHTQKLVCFFYLGIISVNLINISLILRWAAAQTRK